MARKIKVLRFFIIYCDRGLFIYLYFKNLLGKKLKVPTRSHVKKIHEKSHITSLTEVVAKAIDQKNSIIA